MSHKCLYCPFTGFPSKVKRHLTGQGSKRDNNVFGKIMPCWKKAMNDSTAKDYIETLDETICNPNRTLRYRSSVLTEGANVIHLDRNSSVMTDEGATSNEHEFESGTFGIAVTEVAPSVLNIDIGLCDPDEDRKYCDDECFNASDDGEESCTNMGLSDIEVEKGESEIDEDVDGEYADGTGGYAGSMVLIDDYSLHAVLSDVIRRDCNTVREFRSLCVSDQSVLLHAFMNGDAADVVGGFIVRKDLLRLRNGVWLNDELMNHAMEDIQERGRRNVVHIFSTFFYGKLMEGGQYDFRKVKRWSRNVTGKDIFALQKLLFPVNEGNMHWVGVEIDFVRLRILIMDPFGGKRPAIVINVMRYLHDEHKDKKGAPLDDSKWAVDYSTKFTLQDNGYDCGIYTMKYLEARALGLTLQFERRMAFFRFQLAIHILKTPCTVQQATVGEEEADDWEIVENPVGIDEDYKGVLPPSASNEVHEEGMDAGASGVVGGGENGFIFNSYEFPVEVSMSTAGSNLRTYTGYAYRGMIALPDFQRLVLAHGMTLRIEFFRYCVTHKITVEGYKFLTTLSPIVEAATGMRKEHRLPKDRRTLYKSVEKFLRKYVFAIDTKEFTHRIDGKDFKVPYQSLQQCVSYMLHDSTVMRDIQNAMYASSGTANISDDRVLEDLIQQLTTDMSLETDVPFVFDGIHKGYGYLQNLRDTRDLWKNNWNVATSSNMKKVVLSLAVYEDDFTKFKGSKVKSTLFLVTCLEATATGTRLASIATQCLMLAAAAGPKKIDSLYWSQFSEDVRKLTTGVPMIIGNETFMVFAPVLLQTGDSPAICRSLGFHPNVTQIQFPCRFCYTLEENFGPSVLEPALVGSLRTPQELTEMVQQNRGAGPFKTKELEKKYYDLGILEVAAQYAEWPNQRDVYRMSIDTMHMNSLGTCKKFFDTLMDVLTVGIANKNAVYVNLSIAFQRYCKLNGLTSINSRWKSKDQFKGSYVNAWSKKAFFKVSPYLLWLQPKLVPNEVRNKIDARKVRIFQYWTMYCHCVNIMNQRSIDKNEVKLLKVWLPSILQFLQKTYPTYYVTEEDGKVSKHCGMITCNMHYLTHIVEMIMKWGPPIFWACWSSESLIQQLKPLFVNTNSVPESSVFKNYCSILFFTVLDIITGAPNSYNYVRTEIEGTDSVYMRDATKKLICINDDYSKCTFYEKGAHVIIPKYYVCEDGGKWDHMELHTGCFIEMQGYRSAMEGGHFVAEHDSDHTGIFLSFLLNDLEEVFIAYSIPLVDEIIDEHESMKYMTVVEVSTATQDVIIVAPVRGLSRRMNVIQTSATDIFFAVV